jgi:hypothetical protein
MTKVIIAVAIASILSGCATILNEETQKVNVVSSNGKAIEGTIDGVSFKGPGIVDVRRAKADKIVKVTTQGCAAQTSMNKKVSNMFWVNIIAPGGAFGSTIDYSTEKMWEYDNTIEVNCQ